MKRKILRSFLAVYLAVSVAYGGARAAYLTVVAAINPPKTFKDQIELAAPTSFGIDTIPAEPREEAEATSAPAVQAEDAPEAEPEPLPEETAAPTLEAPAEDSTMEAPAEETGAEDSVMEDSSVEESATAEEELIAAPEEPAEDEDTLIEAAPAEDVPTLEDYLSQLHCGRCGRNCYLANPRCRTGRNKAESATETYYEEYGVMGEM